MAERRVTKKHRVSSTSLTEYHPVAVNLVRHWPAQVPNEVQHQPHLPSVMEGQEVPSWTPQVPNEVQHQPHPPSVMEGQEVPSEIPEEVTASMANLHANHRAILVGSDAHSIAELMKILTREEVCALRSRAMEKTFPIVFKTAHDEGKQRPVRVFHQRLLFSTVMDGHLGVVRSVDPKQQPLVPLDYQIRGVLKLMRSGQEIHYAHRHSVQLVLWATGAGKTIWAMLAIGAAYRECPDKPNFRAMLCVPIAAVLQWKRAVATWLHVPKSRILVATNRKRLTREFLESAMIVITTPSTVAEVYKECGFPLQPTPTHSNPFQPIPTRSSVHTTKRVSGVARFMWLNKFAIEVPQPSGRPSKWLARFERLPRPHRQTDGGAS